MAHDDNKIHVFGGFVPGVEIICAAYFCFNFSVFSSKLNSVISKEVIDRELMVDQLRQKIKRSREDSERGGEKREREREEETERRGKGEGKGRMRKRNAWKARKGGETYRGKKGE